MRIYEPTVTGSEIAKDTGLDNLVNHLKKIDYEDPLLDQLSDLRLFPAESAEDDKFEKDAISRLWRGLKTAEERLEFLRALAIDHKNDSWRRAGDLAHRTLFDIQELDVFAPATPNDRLIVSGLVGAQLVNFRARTPLLTKSHHESYGFHSFAQSCAFVGAYVVSRLDNYPKPDSESSLTYSQNGRRHDVVVSGSMHGDFRISETISMEDNVISPAQSPVEYGPKREVVVSGYHSVEPMVLVSMLEHVYLFGGLVALKSTVSEFKDIIDQMIEKDGGIGYRRGNFADYGDNDMDFELIRLERLVNDKSNRRLQSTAPHLQEPHLPGSDTMFEIVSEPGGIKFQNRTKGMDPAPGILVEREHFGQLFASLLRQTWIGAGRTSPSQILTLIKEADKLVG